MWNGEKQNTPLLIHTNTNDEDVNVIEVEHLIQALKAAGKKMDNVKVGIDAGQECPECGKPLAKRAPHSAVASERLAVVIVGSPVGSGCESTPNRGTRR